ncbi:MAG: methylated-DNA--[protein]-cysteine S-methyltransferase [Solirubrobacterales bacterium]|nr:methylated-DNA--[protein]-cysteine S-methyltransferase [Solirubrobacterales bacterium]
MNGRTEAPDPEAALWEAARDARPRASELAAAVAARAEGEGLLDVAYATVESPYGELMVAVTDRGVVQLSLPNYSNEEALARLAREVSPRVLEAPARLDPVRRELDAYFSGSRSEFTVRVDWRLSHGFRGRVLHAIAGIPYGQTRSYSELAAEAGNPRAFRAAGTACGANPVPLIVPCHRVVKTDGSPGNYGGGPEMKLELLRLERAL